MSYLKLQFNFNRVKSYYETLITHIKSVPNYDDGLPVCYVGNNIKDSNIHDIVEFDDIYIDGAAGINNYARDIFLDYWLGFKPTILNDDIFDNNTEVLNMPCYPDYGSIKVIDGVVVVKFE